MQPKRHTSTQRAAQAFPDGQLIALGDLCPGLREAVLERCYSLSDHGAGALGASCPALRSLSLSGSYQVFYHTL